MERKCDFLIFQLLPLYAERESEVAIFFTILCLSYRVISDNFLIVFDYLRKLGWLQSTFEMKLK